MGNLKKSLLRRQENIKEGKWPELTRFKEDPIKWELLYHQLLGIVQEGRETARLISASPTVREFGECVFALFTPEGESIAFSRGILLHMASMGSSIQWMLEHDYEEIVGINDGDIFYNNDPDIGGAHSADQAVLLPVFYENKIIAWVGGLTHCMETGSTEPGGMSPSALSRYDDGQMIPCMKVGTNNQFNPDFHIMVSRNVRDGKWWILDDRAKLAGCLKMKQALLNVVGKLGTDYFKDACYEMIESGREFAVNKIKTMFFPGRYRSTAFYDVPFSTQPIRLPMDYLMMLPCEVTIDREGQMDISFEGSSSAGNHSNNASFACTQGLLIYTLLQDSLYDGFFNQGLAYAYSVNMPRGSVLNPHIDKACSCWYAATAALVGGGLTSILSRAFYTQGFREEGFASKAITAGMFAGGLAKDGSIFAIFNFELNCSGLGASSNADGVNAGQAAWNPEVNMSDCETFEHLWPLMWLGRGIYKDGGGYGRRRGGAGVESLYVIEHEPLYVESGCIGSGDKVLYSPGLFGGYPAPSRYRHCLANTNYKEAVEKQLPLPHRVGDDPANPDFTKLLKGDLVRTPGQSAGRVFGPYDLIHQFTGGGGGWGDPLAREVELIESDLADDLISEKTARSIYCVEVVPGTKKVNPEQTKALREAEKKARLKKAIPVEAFVKTQREKIMIGEISAISKKYYNDCFHNSPKFLNEFKSCWSLPENFKGF